MNKEGFRADMMDIGEKLNEEEVEELINLVNQNETDIDINCI